MEKKNARKAGKDKNTNENVVANAIFGAAGGQQSLL
jgi:hypothetical protein